MIQALQPYIGNIITLLIGGFIGWFPNRKKTAIDNNQSIVDLYQDSLTDLKARYEEKYQDLKLTFDEKLKGVSDQVNDLKKSLDDWKNKYFSLKNDFDKYKKQHP
jgi:molecular chaperone GrpE (heat shock protein)